MKAAPFEYRRADTLDEVLATLAAADGDARVLAGGQTLVPMLAMRLLRPAMLVDINRVAALAGIVAEGTHVTIRTCTRQRAAERSGLVRQRLPLLTRALGWVGHHQTRNRGTVGGSMAHGDPAAEIPLVAVTLGAELRAASRTAERRIDARRFYAGPMATVLEPDECLLDVRFPVWEGHVGTAFQEVSRRSGDFAMLAVAAQLEVDADGRCRRASVGIGGAAPVPLHLAAVGDALAGTKLDDGTIERAAGLVPSLIDPTSDLHADAGYRRRVAPGLVARAIRAAAAEVRPMRLL